MKTILILIATLFLFIGCANKKTVICEDCSFIGTNTDYSYDCKSCKVEVKSNETDFNIIDLLRPKSEG